jgi:hypothetical protein
VAYIATIPRTGQLYVRLLPLRFVPRFVVVRFRHEDERLDANEDLEQCALATDPAGTRPGTQKRKTNLAAIVQVRVEPDAVIVGCQKLDVRRRGGIIVQMYIKQVNTVLVGRIDGTGNEYLVL